MLFKFAFRNVFSKKSSFIIIIFIAFAVCLFCVANAVFDSTENGVKSNFVSSFTGDFIIRPNVKGVQGSLFGDETPVTGELTKLSTVIPYSDITAYLEQNADIQSFTSQVTGMAALEFNGQRTPVYLFGVHSSNYFSMMSSVKVVEGEPYSKDTKSVMLSKFMAQKTGAGVGSTVQFAVSDGPYFRLRKAEVTGIYDYDIANSIFERFILIDPSTLRGILDIDDAQVVMEEDIEEDKMNLLSDELDFDSLFQSADDSFAEYESFEDSDFFGAEDIEITAEPVLETAVSDSVVWHYIICKVAPKTNVDKAIKKINRICKKNGWPVEAVNWRYAAGSTALYLYWLRIIMNIGIAVVLIAGFIIVNNTLTVNILERTVEIGTLRAIGAKKLFVSLQCMVETFILTISGGILGTALGILASKLITNMHITFTNSFLIQLFGSSSLVVSVTGFNVFKLFILVTGLGVLGWIYPVINALKVTPVKAMQGAK